MEGIKAIINKHKFIGNIHVCLVDYSKEHLLKYIHELKKIDSIKTITIPIKDIYKICGEKLDVRIGYEYWDTDYSCCGLKLLDGTGLYPDDVWELIGYVETVIDEILSFDPQNELEKIILTDIWFQKNIQYIKARESIVLVKKT